MFVSFSEIQGFSSSGLPGLVMNAIEWLVNLTVVLCVVMIIVAGLQYIFSFGDQDKIKKATSSIVFAILGMVLAFIAPNVIQFVLDTFVLI